MQIKAFAEQGRDPLVLFSGDAFNPSMMSTITLGKQMVPVLNEFGVACSCMGNHDFDYGRTFPPLVCNLRCWCGCARGHAAWSSSVERAAQDAPGSAQGLALTDY